MSKNFMKGLLFFILGVVAIWMIIDLISKTEEVDIYYTNLETTKLEKQKKNIKSESEEELLEKVILELTKKPSKMEYKKIIPDNVDIEKFEYINNTIHIYVTKYYEDLSKNEKRLLRTGLIETFTQFDFVIGIYMYVDGKPLKNDNGENVGLLKKEDVISENNQVKEKSIEVDLYFSDDMARKLVVEKRKIVISNKELLARKVLNELIIGPKDTDKERTIPHGTEVKEIQIKDKICYVDFNEAFRKNHPGGLTSELLTINAIVDTLVQLDDIEKVQILIEGKKVSRYKEDMDISKPLSN